MNKRNKVLVSLVIVFAIVLAAGIGGLIWYEKNHVRVNGVVFDIDITSLDLRGQATTVEEYENIRAALPDCSIRWDVPFQGQQLPDDTQSLTVTELTEEDMDRMVYFPGLTHVDATGCRDYPAILECMARYPELTVDYQVELGGQTFPKNAEAMEFSGDAVDAAALTENLPYLPMVSSVKFTEPAMTAQELLTLREAFPDVTFHWSRVSYGIPVDDTTTELDLTGMTVDLEELRREAEYLPDLEKVLLIDCGFDNETLAAYRDQVRGEFKPVWTVKVGTMTIRTDDLYFMPAKQQKQVNSSQMTDLRYCEDMLCVDVGHMNIIDCSWLEGMTHLTYLILADTPIVDITPVGTLKELKYLELFMTNVRDVSPLVGCTALEDVSMAVTSVHPEPFAQMPWLKNLWLNRCNVSTANRELLTEALPDTHIEFDHGWPTGGGWRELQNYYDMRDLLGMPYNAW